jgi:hypothetical protein
MEADLLAALDPLDADATVRALVHLAEVTRPAPNVTS